MHHVPTYITESLDVAASIFGMNNIQKNKKSFPHCSSVRISIFAM